MAEPSPGRFALMMAAGLLTVVALLNLLGAAPVEVDPQRLDKAIEQGVVQSMNMVGQDLVIELNQEVGVIDQGQRRRTRTLHLTGPVAEEQLEAWGAAGFLIGHLPAEDSSWGGAILVGGLLGVSFVYLGWLARHYRQHGSPRTHLDELEKRYQAGELSWEDYQQKAEIHWSRM